MCLRVIYRVCNVSESNIQGVQCVSHLFETCLCVSEECVEHVSIHISVCFTEP
jgi:hypothetical protein